MMLSTGRPILTDEPPRDRAHMRAALAAVIGNGFEYYDYFLYTTAAALVFGQIFFPGADPAASTLMALGSYAVGFISRPFGGLVFGHIGDRYGRKSVMVWTLSLMGFATFTIGLLPTYAQVGVFAPVTLTVLRLVQGLAAGGEWGGAVLMTTENAPPHRRGFYGAWSQAGVGLGFVLASAAFLLAQQLPREDLLSWGWRIPFLASALIFSVGIYIRTHVPESREYQDNVVEADKASRRPLTELATRNGRALLVATALRLAEMCGSHLTTTFALAYGALVGAPAGTLLVAVMVSMLADTVMTVLLGALSDRIGRRKIYLAGIVGMAAINYPFFLMIGSGDTGLIITAMLIANGLCHAAMISVEAVLLTDLFPVQVRASGISMAQAISAVIAGFVPLAAIQLYREYGSPLPVTIMMLLFCLASALALAATLRTGSHAPSGQS
ncbi:MFS transporter [Sphingomonas sp. Root50]|nr:MFS transporter [Sphingomonas sp. Root1294]KQY66192.1 MFS transporter [Sphingomonas sp. Root50]KRB89711.1 MFS transporter [Sphingomonas sp. Root720]